MKFSEKLTRRDSMESKHRFLLKIYPDTLESKHRRIFISPNEMRRRNGKILRNQRIILKQNFSTLLSISTIFPIIED